MKNESNNCEREFDFSLIITGIKDLTSEVEDALFEAGCDDATLIMKYGNLYAEFSRSAVSFEEAVLSAIENVHAANVGAEVLRIDECNLVTASDIARRIGRSRQLVNQYMTGKRGPGGFPPPEYHYDEKNQLWAWCAVSYWFIQNDVLKPEDGWNAEVIVAINNLLETDRQRKRHRPLIEKVTRRLATPKSA